MSETIDPLGGRRPLPQLIAEGALSYQDGRQAKVFLDRLRVPFIVIRRVRHYHPADIRKALDRETRRMPRRVNTHENVAPT